MSFSTSARAIAAGCLLFYAAGAGAAQRTLDVAGGKIVYETCGAGPQAVVLLHDGILHSAAYEDVWPMLCQRYRVVRYDRRGYGASPASSGPYKPAEDLAALMKGSPQSLFARPRFEARSMNNCGSIPAKVPYAT